jgi:hypothetical protein
VPVCLIDAEIIRKGIHLAAMSSRVRDKPLDWPAFDGPGRVVILIAETPGIGGYPRAR